jgi:glutamine amidotransferase
LLYSKSSENNVTTGLNLINGKVDLLSKNKKIKLPNVGWQKIKLKEKLGRFKFLINFNNKKFYFVHSFICNPVNNDNILATTTYKNIKFCSISTNYKNAIGVQFHPEKSGDTGLFFLETLFNNLT